MKAYANWIISGVAILLALFAIIRTPPDLSIEVQQLSENIDTLYVAAARSDSVLAVDIHNLDAKVDSVMKAHDKILADSVRVLRASVVQVQKSMISVSQMKRVEQAIKVTAQKSDFTESELYALREAFKDHKSMKAKDAHGDKKIAMSSGNNSWWGFVSPRKGGSK